MTTISGQTFNRASRRGWKPPETCECRVCSRLLAWHADDSVRMYGVAHDDQHDANGRVTCSVCRNQPNPDGPRYDIDRKIYHTFSQKKLQQVWRMFREGRLPPEEQKKAFEYVRNATEQADNIDQRLVAGQILAWMCQYASETARGMDTGYFKRCRIRRGVRSKGIAGR